LTKNAPSLSQLALRCAARKQSCWCRTLRGSGRNNGLQRTHRRLFWRFHGPRAFLGSIMRRQRGATDVTRAIHKDHVKHHEIDSL
jgi:hypothetical protein